MIILIQKLDDKIIKIISKYKHLIFGFYFNQSVDNLPHSQYSD